MKINVGIRMDQELKEQFEACCDQLELSMTAAVNLFARAVVRERRIPFDIRIDPISDVADGGESSKSIEGVAQENNGKEKSGDQ